MRKTGWPPGLPEDRRLPAPYKNARSSLAASRTEPQRRRAGLRSFRGWAERYRELLRLSLGAGDGFQSHPAAVISAPREPIEDAGRALRLLSGGALVSRTAIAAALARNDLSAGERLVAFSLASFADRDARTLAWYAGGGGESWVEAQLVPRGARAARAPRPGGRGAPGNRARPGEHALVGVRRDGTVVGRRHQRRAVRDGAQLQPRQGRRPAAARRGGRAGGRGAGRRGRNDAAAVRGGGVVGDDVPSGAEMRCLPPASWRSAAATAAGGRRTAGRSRTHVPAPARRRPWAGDEWRRPGASARCSRTCRPRPRRPRTSGLARKSRRSIRAARIGSPRP